ncbi:hypothetical protein D3C78_729600 [compost metagenome]
MVGANIDVQLCARTVGIALIEHFQQPLVDPRLRQEPAGFASLGRQFERHAGADVFIVRRQIGSAVTFGHHTAVERHRQAVGITVDVRSCQFHQTHARPVGRTFVEAMRRHEAEKRDRQPDTVEQIEAAFHVDAERRFGFFDLFRFGFVEKEVFLFVVRQAADQPADHRCELARRFLAGIQAQGEIHELDAGVADQCDGVFELSDFRQHVGLFRFYSATCRMDMGNCSFP